MGKWSMVGKRIAGVSVAGDACSVRFDFDDGTAIRLDAEGDCCSSSWIENFDNAEDLVGGVVLRVEEKDVANQPDGLSESKFPGYQQEYDQLYFYEIVTDKAAATIEMRNSSNGCYGGWLQERAA